MIGNKEGVLDAQLKFARENPNIILEFKTKSNHRIGRFSDASKSKAYQSRIEAINFSLAHDDGQTQADLDKSDVILVGVSRSGKTPTSLYLAMQYGLKAANYPLIPEDFERRQLPPALAPLAPRDRRAPAEQAGALIFSRLFPEPIRRTLTALSGTNMQVVGGTHVEPIVKNPSINCHRTSGYGATAQAGCGSLQIAILPER